MGRNDGGEPIEVRGKVRPSRLEKMQMLREAKLTDDLIGAIFDVTRERVAQLCGRKRLGQFDVIDPAITKTIKAGLEAGDKLIDIRKRVGSVKLTTMHMEAAGLKYADYREARSERRRAGIVNTVADLAKRGVIDPIINVGEIRRKDYVLYGRITANLCVPELRKRVHAILGVKGVVKPVPGRYPHTDSYKELRKMADLKPNVPEDVPQIDELVVERNPSLMRS